MQAPRLFAAAALLLYVALGPGAEAALARGKYTLWLRSGRTTCGDNQGFLSAPTCASTDPSATLFRQATASGRQQWWLTPVDGGDLAEGATVWVKASGGRQACGPYLTYRATCNGPVTVAKKLAAAKAWRQQWVLERQADGSFGVRPLRCPGRRLGLGASCASKGAQLLADGTGLSSWAVSTGTQPPAVEDPPGNNDPPTGLVPNVAITVSKTSDWGAAYDGAIAIKNLNDFAITDWYLTYTFNDDFTWQSDFIIERTGNKVKATPNNWLKKIEAGATLVSVFGGLTQLPQDIQFVQLSPKLGLDLSDGGQANRGVFGNKLFSPYLDILHWPTPQLQNIIDATGQKFFTLAFVVAMGKRPGWGGVIDIEDKFFLDQIRALRAQGGDVIISFGGCNGEELASVITDVDELVAAYQLVVDTYDARWLDFDIEGSAVTYTEEVDRRNKALAKLQAANPGLIISYCLPVLPVGLTRFGVAMLANAVQNNVRVDVVQVMTMDYGGAAAPDPEGNMGAYAIQACESTYDQALSVGMTTKIGAIPMIGVNDVLEEVFRLDDACQLAAFAAATPWMRTTAFWSVNRDNYAGDIGAAPGSSGIPQQPYDFTKLMGKMDCRAASAGSKRLARAPAAANAGASDAELAAVLKRAYRHNWEAWTSTYPGLDNRGSD